MTEDEMIRWHHRLSGQEFEPSLGDTEGHGSLACCSPQGCKESDMILLGLMLGGIGSRRRRG